ncbi:MAG TPA: hypothetical protein VFQ85_02285 [Mycobacteriales bacterium]|jgi:hypothetical protein|nr:hypothetical protein [Mycobacteriales bacterium]
MRRALFRLVTVTTAVLTALSSGASATPVERVVHRIDAATSLRGAHKLHQLAADPRAPREARDAMRQALDSLAGTRISVTDAPAATLARVKAQPSWSADRAVTSVNGAVFVVDRTADFLHLLTQVVPQDGSRPFSLDLRIEPRAGSWLGHWRTSDGRSGTEPYAAPKVNQCTRHCLTAGIAIGLIALLFCTIVVVVGDLLGALVCGAGAVVVAGDVGYICDSVVQACDDDPTKDYFHAPPPELECAQAWDACDTRGVFSAHLYQSELTGFDYWLSFWFNTTDYGFNIFSGSDLGLTKTMDLAAHKVWRYGGFMYSPIPGAECAPSATAEVFLSFGTAGSAYTKTGAPKLVRPESNCVR